MAAGDFADLLTIRGPRFRSPLVGHVLGPGGGRPGDGAVLADRPDVRPLLRTHPERPRRTPLLADFVLVLAGLLNAGSLFGAIAMGFLGILRRLPPSDDRRGLVLHAPGGRGPSPAVPTRDDVHHRAMGGPRPPGRVRLDTLRTKDRRARKWWEGFRLALLLAIGPGLIALALAAATRIELPRPRIVIQPNCVKVVVTTQPWDGQEVHDRCPPSRRSRPGQRPRAPSRRRRTRPKRSWSGSRWNRCSFIGSRP